MDDKYSFIEISYFMLIIVLCICLPQFFLKDIRVFHISIFYTHIHYIFFIILWLFFVFIQISVIIIIILQFLVPY